MGPQNGEGGEAATNSGPSQAPLQPNGVHAPETDAAAPGEVGEEGAAQAWDAREDLPTMPGFRLLHSLTGHTRAVSSVKFARQSPLLASASADGTAKLWNADTGQLVHTLQGHTKGLSDVCWNREGGLLATASDDATLRLWDAETGQSLRVLEGHTHYVFSCCFSEGGNLLASGSFDETIRLWDVRSGKCLKAIPGHSDPVTSVDFNSTEGEATLASSSFDGLARLWKAANGKCLQSLMADGNPPMSFVRFTPNSKFLLVGTLDGRLCLWDFVAKKVKKVYQGHRNKHLCLQAAFLTYNPSGAGTKHVVCGSEDSHIYFWDLNKPKDVRILRGRPAADAPGDGHFGPVLSVATHLHRPLMASAGYEQDKTVRVWTYGDGGEAPADGEAMES